MKKFGGYEDAKKNAQSMGSEKLPAGAYICKIKNVQYVEGQDGKSDRIDLLFDITEGEFKDFFKKQYDSNTAEDKKWKGRTSVYVPKEDGSEMDEWTKNAFARWTNAFEDSNSGYKWNWDETKWKGLAVGIVFGETGTVIDDKEIVYTEARFGCAVSLVKEGKAPKAKFKKKNGYGDGSASSTADERNEFAKIPEGAEEEIPF